MRFPRKEYPTNDTPSREYSLGFADAESHYAQVIAFAETYISLLERQVSALQQALNKRDNQCSNSNHKSDS